MANADTCVICGATVPEGWQVCPTCDAQSMAKDKPAGFLSSADVEMLAGLHGYQIQQLFRQYGTQIGGRTYIETRLFDELWTTGKLRTFKAYPMYSPRLVHTGQKKRKMFPLGRFENERSV